MQRIVVFCHHNTQRLVCSTFCVLPLFLYLCFLVSARVSPCRVSVPPSSLFRGCCCLNCCSSSIFCLCNISPILTKPQTPERALCLSHTQSRAPLIELLFLPHFRPATACYRLRRNFQLRTATTCFLTSPPSRSSHRNLPFPPSRSHRANVEASVAQPRSRRRQLCSTVATFPFESPFQGTPCLSVSLFPSCVLCSRLLASRNQKSKIKEIEKKQDELKEKLARIYDVKDPEFAFVFKFRTHF